MSQTYVFEELDDATLHYLTAVRAAEGVGMPGMFASTSTAFPGCSCLSGLVLIPLTLLATLTDWVDIIYNDPVGVAFLQTAGLLLGGWLVFAYLRAKGGKGTLRMAGHWVYMDPVNFYEAYREQVTITRIDDAEEANYVHNYNNGNYQNSVVRVVLGGGKTTSFTINDELRAEQFTVFVNYLGWARGSDGGPARELPPPTMGAVARYVARHDVEPKDSAGNINLDLVELDIDEVPEEPSRVGRAAPSILPYIVIVFAAIVIFVVMAYVVNPPIRDDAIYSTVIKYPEPRFLRAYLIDHRNTLHRQEALDKLSSFYGPVIFHVTTRADQPQLKAGMLKILNSLKSDPDQPVVSLRVTERSPASISNGATERVRKLREGLVGGELLVAGRNDGILDVFGQISPAINIPGVILNPPPPPIGHQLIAFVEKPEEAQNANFEIIYELKPTDKQDTYLLTVKVEIRDKVDDPPIATYEATIATYPGNEQSLDGAIDTLRTNLVRWMVGKLDNG